MQRKQRSKHSRYFNFLTLNKNIAQIFACMAECLKESITSNIGMWQSREGEILHCRVKLTSLFSWCLCLRHSASFVSCRQETTKKQTVLLLRSCFILQLISTCHTGSNPDTQVQEAWIISGLALFIRSIVSPPMVSCRI